jgi:hypothetical protein
MRLPSIAITAVTALFATASFFPQANAQTSDPARQLQQTEPVKSWPSKAKRWALVIGVDKYVDAQISPLKGADNDARTLSDALVRYSGFPQDQVILLSTDQPAERQPTRINILRRLSNLASVVPKDGLLLISFAGHGIERGGQAYLIPSDSQITDDITLLEESAVSVSRLRDRIRTSGVGQVVIFLDACRNDPGGRADAPNPLTEAYVNAFNFDVRNREVAAFATIYATAVGQRAYEYTEKKQGYFTWAIVEALKGRAANEKGEVTLASLIRYVQETVPKRVAIDLGGSKQQRPFSQMEGYKADDLVIAVTSNVVANTSTPAVPTVDPTAFELAYWDTIKNSNNANDFKSYLDKYPDGQFTALARNKINSLQPNDTAPTTGNSQAEITYWDSIKNSNNPDDYRAYLRRYPDGVFSDLARTRLAPFEAAEKEKEREADIKRRTKTFTVQAGVRSTLVNAMYPGTLSVGPRGIEWSQDVDGQFYDSRKKGEAEIERCSYFTEAKLDGADIKEIHTKNTTWDYKWRIRAESPQQAKEVLDAIRTFCNGSSTSSIQPSDKSQPSVPASSVANKKDSTTASGEDARAPARTYSKIRNGSSKAAPEGTLSLSGAGLEFTSNGGKTLFIKCSEVLKVSTSSANKLMTVKTTSGDHHFNDLVSIFGSSPSLEPVADDIRDVCKLSK